MVKMRIPREKASAGNASPIPIGDNGRAGPEQTSQYAGSTSHNAALIDVTDIMADVDHITDG